MELPDNSIIAPCGMNCGLCMAYLRERNKCLGCREPDDNKPITRLRCKITNCEVFNNDNIEFCFECEDFPCDQLKHLDKRYRNKYHMSMIQNLETIKKFGLKKFLKDEDEKWTCPVCGGTICVHYGSCYNCGEKYNGT